MVFCVCTAFMFLCLVLTASQCNYVAKRVRYLIYAMCNTLQCVYQLLQICLGIHCL